MSAHVTQVGTSAIVLDQRRRVLLGRRCGAHGGDTWGFPGGKCDFGEDPRSAAARELLEETGLRGLRLLLAAVTNDLFPERDAHFVTLHFLVLSWDGGPEVKEPEKCTAWAWCSLHQPPQPLFGPTAGAISQLLRTAGHGSESGRGDADLLDLDVLDTEEMINATRDPHQPRRARRDGTSPPSDVGAPGTAS